MSDCLRYLINADHCFELADYEMFFYRLQSEFRLRISQVQLAGEHGTNSLRKAFSDLRVCLNKYPYCGQIDEYQIIVAMNLRWQPAAEWSQTLLYRLLQIRRAMHLEDIHVEQGDGSRRALNLVVMWERCPGVPAADERVYMSGKRFREDCELLLKTAGLQNLGEATLEQMAAAAEKMPKDSTEAELLDAFVEEQNRYSELEVTEESCIGALFVEYVSKILVNTKVFECIISDNLQDSPRQKMKSMLYLVDYINYNFSSHKEGDRIRTTLADRCQEAWDSITGAADIERRYGEMLCCYRKRLTEVQDNLKNSQFVTIQEKMLPESKIDDNGEFDPEAQNGEKETDPIGILKAFIDRRISGPKVCEEWEKVHASLRECLGDMEGSLHSYAAELSRRYTRRLSERKKESLMKENVQYHVDEAARQRLEAMRTDLRNHLDELKDYQKRPSLSFQDQLNIEAELEEEGAKIHDYTKRLSAVRARGFLLLMISVLLIFVLHYSILQTFVFSSLTSLAVYGGCILAVFVLLTFAWQRPMLHYRSLIKSSVRDLIARMEEYIKGYTEQRKLFRDYIITLDKVDQLNLAIALYETAIQRTQWLEHGKLWHSLRLSEHLERLAFFNRLMDGCSIEEIRNSYTAADLFTHDQTAFSDVISSSVYWPQEDGDNI